MFDQLWGGANKLQTWSDMMSNDTIGLGDYDEQYTGLKFRFDPDAE